MIWDLHESDVADRDTFLSVLTGKTHRAVARLSLAGRRSSEAVTVSEDSACAVCRHCRDSRQSNVSNGPDHMVIRVMFGSTTTSRAGSEAADRG